MSEYAPCTKCGSSQFASDRIAELEAMMLDETYEKRIELQANRIAKLEQENASYFKQAQLYLVEKERAEANLKESDRRLTTHYESATEYRMRWKGAEASAKDWESSYHSEHDSMLREERRADKADAEVEKFHQGFILQQAEAEKLEADLKEQTRLGLACHDELAELKAKYQESEDGSKMVDAENDPANQRKGSDE